MTRSAAWTLVVLAVLAVLAAALVGEFTDDGSPSSGGQPAREARDHRDADTPEALAGLRQRADLPPCPAPRGGEGPEQLRGIVVQCAANGSPVDVAPALAGRTVVLNLWAYWCGPCAEELPALERYQQLVGPAVTVVTVHQDENEAAALARMADLGVKLPVLQDGRRTIAAALGVPNVMPATVVLRADGSVVSVLPTAFTSADEVAAAVDAAR